MGEYTEKNGKPITTVTLGDELQVHLRFRALGAQPISSVALVDLLPGGFEVVENATPAPQVASFRPVRRPTNQGEGEGEGGGGEREGAAWIPTFGAAVGSGSPEDAEVREDRVNGYGVAHAPAPGFASAVHT